MPQQGTVNLRSGRWDWIVRPQYSGAAVVFHHRDRPSDELRTWSPDALLTPARATDLALDPVERRWADPDGIVWTIEVELPSDWARTSVDAGERALRVVFTYGSISRSAWAPVDFRIGDLTHTELTTLLREAR